MKLRCPACGASYSLDILIVHDEAREAIATVWKISGDLGKALLRYIALFRPAKGELTLSRVAKLIGELIPDLHAQQIMRSGVSYAAPVDIWIHAIDQVLLARETQRLQLPLKTHGFLYEVIAGTARSTGVAVAQPPMQNAAAPAAPVSNTRRATGSLLERAQAARGREK